MRAPGDLDGCPAIACLTDHRHVASGADDARETGSQQDLVVGDDDADHAGAAAIVRSVGDWFERGRRPTTL